jgi:excinuclease ABC subunit A
LCCFCAVERKRTPLLSVAFSFANYQFAPLKVLWRVPVPASAKTVKKSVAKSKALAPKISTPKISASKAVASKAVASKAVASKAVASKAVAPKATAPKKSAAKIPAAIGAREAENIAKIEAQIAPPKTKTPRKSKVDDAYAPINPTPDNFIIIKGARQHNLKDIDLVLPRHKLIVITGLSGSGKSSLAFDTIYAEGQRRYVESLSAYARQFLGQMEKPDVDFIEGLSPAVSIDQKTASRNPRSTVATVTEIYDYLRLLFARAGTPHCPNCDREIARQSVDQITNQILDLGEGARLHILAPLVRGRKGEYRKIFEDARKKGFARVRVNGTIYNLDEADDIKLERYEKHDIEIVVDRAVVKNDARSRLADSVQTALQLGEGIVLVEVVSVPDGEQSTLGAKANDVLSFSEHFACAVCNLSFEELEPRTFSFNSPYGACPECSGLGFHQEFDPKLVMPDERLSLEEGALAPWKKSGSNYKKEMLRSIAKQYGFDVNAPVSTLTQDQKNVVLYGTDSTKIHISYVNMHGRRRAYQTPFEGVLASLQNEYSEYGDKWREELQKYRSDKPCPTCKGARLKPFPLAVTVLDKNIAQVTHFSVGDASRFFNSLRGPQSTLSSREAAIARTILKEIDERLQFLVDVGLDYLNLDRTANTLSGGEAQRIRLATQIGSGLVGVLYVLDEPSIGLHQRDNEKLLKTLVRLRDLGNTVIVVEHDEDTMRAADHIVDIGPKAGEHGGRVVAQGTLAQIMKNPESATGRFLTGVDFIPRRATRREPTGWLEVKNAREHNLRGIDVKFPLGCLVCVTGVSGSGKSTLVEDILHQRLAHEISGSATVWGAHDDVLGMGQIDKIINIDQSPIGRTPRSNPATYTGAFTPLRDLFALTRESKARGYGPGRFSFNVKGGRCENCQGDGIIKIEMHFLPDVYVPCEVCAGKRYNRETLDVHYKGHSIADVLSMTVAEALEVFEPIPSIGRKMQTIVDVGLGYIRLGQPATTLSGGEAQRVKLATELSKRSTGHTLYILDEPSVGLHMADVKVLIEVLQRLTDQGNTILVIEHNLDVIACADYLIDLGPEGGAGGGWLIGEGTPEELMAHSNSYTGQFLKMHLKRHGK